MVYNEIFASLHSNAVRRSAYVCAVCTYKCSFGRKMSNGGAHGQCRPLYQNVRCVRVRNFRGVLNFSSIRAYLCIVTPSSPSHKIALTFLMDHRRSDVSFEFLNARKFRAVWAYENNNRRPRGTNFRDNWPFSFPIGGNENSSALAN